MIRLDAHRLLLGGAILTTLIAQSARACPFCSGVSITLGEEMGGAATAAAVIAKLIELPMPVATTNASDQPPGADSKAKFEIVKVLKGKEILKDDRQIEVLYFGQDEPGRQFLIMGAPPIEGASQPSEMGKIIWNTPISLTDRAVEYVAKLPELPANGPDRLAYFQQYFEDAEEMLARDAYDEFAKAPYAEVKELKDRMKHDQLVAWINKPEVPPSRRRLYLTMLGVCGDERDLPMLREILKSDNRDMKTALDAVIACYLTLAGANGLSLIEDRFLKNPDAEYTDTYAAIMALRFHGQEESVIPKERLVKSLEYMLDRPQLADLVIPDLARWEDWQVTDRLVKLFKDATDETSWVRVPVINFLKASPEPKAKTYIEELAKIDPDAIKRATSAFPFAAAAPAAVPPPDASAQTPSGANGSPAQPEGAAENAADEKSTAQSPSAELNNAELDVLSTTEADQPATAPPIAKAEAADSESSDAQAPVELAAATGQHERLVEPPLFSNVPAWLVVVIPVVAGLFLLVVFLMVLRGYRRQPNA